MSCRTLGLAAVLCAGMIFPIGANAQGGATGAITGEVVNAKGTAISNAQIEIVPSGAVSALRTVFSDASGNFTAASLPVGVYDVTVKASGFSTSKFSDVAVRLTETTRLNPSLTAPEGQAQEQEGVGQAPRVMVVTAPVVAIETSSAATGRTVEDDVIGSLPLATQNFHQLLTLSTGASSDLNASAQLGRGDVGSARSSAGSRL